MRYITYLKLIIAASFIGCKSYAFQGQDIVVGQNKNLELMFTVYNQTWTPFLDKDVSKTMLDNTRLMQISYNRFKEFKDHKAIQLSKEIMKRSGTDYFLFAFYYYIFPSVKRKKTIPSVILKDINPKEELAYLEIDSLMLEISKFGKESNFDSFYQENAYVYKMSIDEVSKNLPGKKFIPFMESYFGIDYNSYQFIVIPFFKAEFGMAHQVITDKKVDNYTFISPFKPAHLNNEQILSVGYDSTDGVLEWAVHEYAHLFFNPSLFLKENQTALDRYKHLYKPIPTSPQIGNWNSMFGEHLAVAFEVRAAQLLGNSQKGREILGKHKDWPYLNHFIDQLKFYEANRKKYPGIESFMLVLIASCAKLK